MILIEGYRGTEFLSYRIHMSRVLAKRFPFCLVLRLVFVIIVLNWTLLIALKFVMMYKCLI